MSATTAQPLPAPAPVTPAAAVDVPRPWLAQVLYDTVGRTGARLGLIWIAVVGFLAVFAPFIASSHPYILKTSDPLLMRKYGGAWSSPWLQHLGPADVVLPLLAFTALALWLARNLRTGQRLALFSVAFLVLLPATLWKTYYIGLRDLLDAWPAAPRKGGLVFSLVWTHLLIAADVALLLWLVLRAGLPRRALTVTLSCLAAVTLLLVVFPVTKPVTAVYEEFREAQAAGMVQVVVRPPLPYSASDRLRDQFDPDRPHPRAPSKQNWLGTEQNGADVLSRMIHACRIAMAIGFIATGIAVVIGSIVGGLMGYFVGWVDLLGMRVVEIFGSVPTIYLLLAFVAFFERNLYMMMVIIGLTTWVGDARFVRAEFLKLRNQDFVHAARAAGLPLPSILFRHMLPNAMAPLLVAASFGVASAILYESTLSFLGLGLVDDPSWGQLLNQAVSAAGKFDWWLATFPGLAIFLTVFAYNLIGEALRDALDPKLKGVQ
jgi:peptide/nickel transport system permease protein